MTDNPLPELLQLLALAAPILLADTAQPPPGLLPLSQVTSVAIKSPSSKLFKLKALFMAHALRHRSSRFRAYPHVSGHRITMEWLKEMPRPECRWRFRFSFRDIKRLLSALDIPEIIVTQARYTFSGVEALCLLLARFCTAGELYLLTMLYKRSIGAISQVVNKLCMYLNERWSHLLNFDHTGLFKQTNLVKYAHAFHNEGGTPLPRLIGLIDCTIRRISRPCLFQRVACNGHKKYHALKYQALMLPNGLIGHLYGPIEGRRADPALLADSGLLEKLEQYAQVPHATGETPVEDRYFQIYGDPAYGVSPIMLSPFSGAGKRTAEEQDWNARMAAVRIEVEHGFGGIVNFWPFLNAFWKMRLFSSPVGIYYRVAVILTNALNCLHPNQTAQYFNCDPLPYTNIFTTSRNY